MGEMCKGENFLPLCHWEGKGCHYDCLHTHPLPTEGFVNSKDISPQLDFFQKRYWFHKCSQSVYYLHRLLLSAGGIQKYERGFVFEKLQRQGRYALKQIIQLQRCHQVCYHSAKSIIKIASTIQLTKWKNSEKLRSQVCLWRTVPWR